MNEASNIKVADAMTTGVKTMDATATVKDAINAMRDSGVS